jgi:23S rRNA pseudouridine1911/1915/1917 synthase
VSQQLPNPTAETPLLAWLLEALRPMSRTGIKELLRDGRVAVNGTPTTRFDHPLRPGDRVTLLDRTARRAPDLPILFEDDNLIAVDKPPGLLTVATAAEKTDTAFVRLKTILEGRRAGRPYVVHRLDRETSGLLLFARTPQARDALLAAWDGVAKTYLAVVEGAPKAADGVIENHLVEGSDLKVRACGPDRPGAKRAVTHYRVLAEHSGLSLLEVGLETGRKHQIRVHLAGLGCPVAGDALYGAKTDPAGRLCLHAWRLALDHPVSGRRIALEAPPPERLRKLVPAPTGRPSPATPPPVRRRRDAP